MSAEAPDTRLGLRPVVTAWLFLAALTGAPYLRAALRPPPGTTFLGFFYFVDDSYHYLSFAQQAEDGAFLFRNKLVLEDHSAALINIEWWLWGRLAAAMGHRPLLACRVLGLAAALAFLFAADLWLRRIGVTPAHRLPALLLVATGGGLGGLLYQSGARPLSHCIDLTTGLYPFIGLLGNPHFVAGTALLLWALWAFTEGRTLGRILTAILLGSVLGLVRPYDLVLLVAIFSVGVVAGEPVSSWFRRLLPLLGLVPVVLYDGLVFYRNPAFSFFTQAPYAFPGLADVILALSPAVLLALLAVRAPAGAVAAPFRRCLLAWVFLAATVIAIRPVHFSLQFLVGLGFPLLALGAVGLARFSPAVTLMAAVAMSGTAAAAVHLVLQPNPRWYPASERIAAARALRELCRPGETALAPPDIGLSIAGFTACKAYVSHAIAPQYESREADARAFFQEWDPSSRSRFLDHQGIDHLVIPADAGVVPRPWLGDATPFRLSARVGRIGVYSREGRHGR